MGGDCFRNKLCVPRGILIPLLPGVRVELRQNRLHVSRGILIPLLPFGLDVSQTKKMFTPFLRVSPEIVPPCREPTISGDTIGARARATALRHLCGAANYATCNAPASRRDGALPAYGTSCPTRLTRCARNNRWTFGSALCPCPMCKSGAPAKNLQGFFVGYFLAGRLQPRKSARRV